MTNDLDLEALLSQLSPEQIREMLTPYAQQQGVLEQEMALAGQMRRPGGGQHVSPMGAALGGLSDAVGNVSGAFLQKQGLEKQRALNTKMQDEGTTRLQALKEMMRRKQQDGFLRQRDHSMGFDTSSGLLPFSE